MPKKIYNSFTSFLPPVNCDESATRLPSVAAEILFPVHSTIVLEEVLCASQKTRAQHAANGSLVSGL
jgi:hypothetical protein